MLRASSHVEIKGVSAFSIKKQTIKEATKRHDPIVEDNAPTRSTLEVVQRYLYRVEQ